jgi:thioredoxin reductase (NADPH)
MTKEDHHARVVIIGSGPAACTAAIYTARANLSPIMIAGMQLGGQLTLTADVENFPGFAEAVHGTTLVDQMIKQAEHLGTKIIHDHIATVDFNKRPYCCIGQDGTKYTSDVVIICTGAQARWLGLESEKKFRGFGVSGCATCDGFFFKNQRVLVVGGGNTAVGEALYLTHHAKEIFLVHRRDKLRAEFILQRRLFEHPKIKIIFNSVIDEIIGDEKTKVVTGVKLRRTDKDIEEMLDVNGVFVAIGHKPDTDMFKDFLAVDSDGYIITESNGVSTKIPGIFAAGDVVDKDYRQAIIAAASGAVAGIESYRFLAVDKL